MTLRRLFLLFTVASSCGVPALAQTPAEIAAERTRIAAERQKVEADFAAAEKACYARFGVTDCVKSAQSSRRQALADLRRQEVGLNELERKRRTADRLRDLEERQSEQKARQRSDAAAKGQADAQAREQRSAAKAAKAVPQGRAKSSEPKQVEQPDVEENRRRHAERVRDAEEHRARTQARTDKQKKKAAPLPPPDLSTLPAAPASR